MENESEKEETVTLTHGTDIFHGYQVINTQTPVAKIIFIFGAPSPPTIILSQAQRNDEGHHSHSWIKRLAEKLFGRRLALREPIFKCKCQNLFIGGTYIFNQNIYMKKMDFFGSINIGQYVHQEFGDVNIHFGQQNNQQNDNHKQEEDEAPKEKDEEGGFKDMKTSPPLLLPEIVARASQRDYSHSPFLDYMTYPKHADYLLDWLHQQMDNKKGTYREILKPLKAACEYGLFVGPIPYSVFVEEFKIPIGQSQYSKLMADGGKYPKNEFKNVIQTLNLSIFKE